MDKAFWEDLTLEFSTAGKHIPGLWAHVCSEAKKWQWFRDSTAVQMLSISARMVTSRFCFSSQYGLVGITATASLRSWGLSVSVEGPERMQSFISSFREVLNSLFSTGQYNSIP